MKLLVKLYDKSLQWSQHPLAPRYLAAVCFVEASVFPIPPYVMLAPMALAKPERAQRYALIATLFSVLGGVLGYFLGKLLFTPLVLPVLEYFHYVEKYQQAVSQLQTYGFWAVLIAGFMPIPFKFIAISAGCLRIPLLPFLIGSLFGRGTKFFALALIIKFGGTKLEQKLRLALEKVGLVLLLVAAAIALFALYGCGTRQTPARVVQITPSVHRVLKKHAKPQHQALNSKQALVQHKMSRKDVGKLGKSSWVWPSRGKVLSSFTHTSKGIDIGGFEGAPILAAADGEVVYSGNGLRGYGNLIIIKHDKNYLTAYAHNRKNLVKEHEKIRKGQRIAEMGHTGCEKVKLHFEVRKQGKPIDPATILPSN